MTDYAHAVLVNGKAVNGQQLWLFTSWAHARHAGFLLDGRHPSSCKMSAWALGMGLDKLRGLDPEVIVDTVRITGALSPVGRDDYYKAVAYLHTNCQARHWITL
jgi:hypothetical protein